MKITTRTSARRKAVVVLALTLGAVGVTHGVASATAPASFKLGSIKLGTIHHHEDSIKLGSIKLGRPHPAQPGSIKLG